jgi:hypothetical protein
MMLCGELPRYYCRFHMKINHFDHATEYRGLISIPQRNITGHLFDSTTSFHYKLPPYYTQIQILRGYLSAPTKT